MTTILAIDTSLYSCSVALQHNNQITDKLEIDAKKQGDYILPNIQSLLQNSNIKLADLNYIALTIGPGSFTGLRIGAVIAQSLAYAVNIPVVQISTLELLAYILKVKLDLNDNIAIAIDAKMNELYYAQYSLSGAKPLAIVKDCLLKPQDLKLDSDILAFGDAWDIYQDKLTATTKGFCKLQSQALVPEAKYLLPLAKDAIVNNEFVSAFAVKPVYLRNEEAWQPKHKD